MTLTQIVIQFALAAMLLSLSFRAQAQQPTKIPGSATCQELATPSIKDIEALRQGLRELGHVEGRTFTIEYRGAEGKLDRLPSIMNELVQLKVDVLVAPFTGAVRTARQATNTIPIVMVTGTDPVANGWVESLARPGRNITGVFTLAQDLNGKRLELLTEIVPRLSHVAVLMSVNDPASAINHSEYEASARALKVNLKSMEVDRKEPDIESAFQSFAATRVSAVITITSATLFLKQKLIADLAIKPASYDVSRKHVGRLRWSDVIFDQRS
jgi:putative tryptophan/tyrosine transport system substrate-binding protein